MFLALPCSNQNVNEYEYYGVTLKDSILYNSPQILLVGCENGTTIKIKSEIISLNEMETYLVHNQGDLTGTRVISNKPISFISGHECAIVPDGVLYCDHLLEQLPNTKLWGKHFLTAPLLG